MSEKIAVENILISLADHDYTDQEINRIVEGINDYRRRERARHAMLAKALCKVGDTVTLDGLKGVSPSERYIVKEIKRTRAVVTAADSTKPFPTQWSVPISSMRPIGITGIS